MPWIRGGAGPRYLLSFGDVAVACGFLFVNIYTAMQRSVRLEAVGRVSGLYVAAFYMGFGLTAIWTPSRTAMLAAWETASASAAWCTWWLVVGSAASGLLMFDVAHAQWQQVLLSFVFGTCGSGFMFVNVYAMTQKAVGAGRRQGLRHCVQRAPSGRRVRGSALRRDGGRLELALR
jgi:hypothetical protein